MMVVQKIVYPVQLVRIQDLQRLRRIMEGQRLKVGGLAHLPEQGDQTLQPLEIYLSASFGPLGREMTE